MMIQIAVEYAIGDIVQFKIPDSNGDKMQGQVIGYKVYLGEVVTYRLQHSSGETGDYHGISLEKVESEDT